MRWATPAAGRAVGLESDARTRSQPKSVRAFILTPTPPTSPTPPTPMTPMTPTPTHHVAASIVEAEPGAESVELEELLRWGAYGLLKADDDDPQYCEDDLDQMLDEVKRQRYDGMNNPNSSTQPPRPRLSTLATCPCPCPPTLILSTSTNLQSWP